MPTFITLTDAVTGLDFRQSVSQIVRYGAENTGSWIMSLVSLSVTQSPAEIDALIAG